MIGPQLSPSSHALVGQDAQVSPDPPDTSQRELPLQHSPLSQRLNAEQGSPSRRGLWKQRVFPSGPQLNPPQHRRKALQFSPALRQAA